MTRLIYPKKKKISCKALSHTLIIGNMAYNVKTYKSDEYIYIYILALILIYDFGVQYLYHLNLCESTITHYTGVI